MLIIFYFITFFSNILKMKVSFMAYWDELLVVFFAVIYLTVIILLFFYQGKVGISQNHVFLLLWLLVFSLWSYLPNLGILGQATAAMQLFSLFGMSKMMLFYFFAQRSILAEDLTKMPLVIVVVGHLYPIGCLLVYGANFFIKLLTPFDRRLGITSYSFGYEHPAQFSLAIIMLTTLVGYIFYLENKPQPIGLFVLNFTLVLIAGRTTSIAFFLVMLMMLTVRPYLKRFPLWFYVSTFASALFFARERLIQQLLGDTTEARGVLLRTSLKIANTYLPLGSGLGRFGSEASRMQYSQLYYDYQISNIWGMSPERPRFITDSYWAMILGETGWGGVGLIVVLVILIVSDLYQQISGPNKGKESTYILLPLAYALVTSPVDTVLVSNNIILVLFTVCLLLNLNQYYQGGHNRAILG